MVSCPEASQRYLVFICVFVLVVLGVSNVHAFTVTDLTEPAYKDMYAEAVFGWVCYSNQMFLVEDPSGIEKIDIVEQDLSPEFTYVSVTPTKWLFRVSLNLKPAPDNVFTLQVTTLDTSVHTYQVEYICDLPPIMDLVLLNDTLQYYPSLVNAYPYFMFRVNNFNKIKMLTLQVSNVENTYQVRIEAKANNTYLVSLDLKATTMNPYFLNNTFIISNGMTPVTLKLSSFLPRYENVESFTSFGIYPRESDNTVYYPQPILIQSSKFEQSKPIFKTFTIIGFQTYGTYVLGPLTSPIYIEKLNLQTPATQTAYSNNYLPGSTSLSATYTFKFSFPPYFSTSLSSVLGSSYVSLTFTTNALSKADLTILTISSNALYLTQPYPFGYTNGNMVEYVKNVELAFDYAHTNAVMIEDRVSSFFTTPIPTDPSNVDVSPPAIVSLDSYPLPNSPLVVLRMRITDDLSGFRNIDSFGDYTNIVSGDLNDGTYEFVVSQSNANIQVNFGETKIFDTVRNGNQLSTLVYNYATAGLSRYPFKSLNFSSVVDIGFELNDINVSNRSVDNIMYIYVNLVDKNLYPGMIVVPYGADYDPSNMIPFVGQWNESCGCYSIPFTVPMNYPTGMFEFFMNFITYGMYGSGISYFFIDLFGPHAGLRVVSEYADLIGPIATVTPAIASSVVVNEGVDTMLYWNITIQDDYNGFKSGLVSIVSQTDQVRYNRTITAANLIEGNMYQGVYQVGVLVNGKCKSQPFYIQYLYLQDNADRFSLYKEGGEFPTDDVAPFINPLLNMLNVTRDTAITVDCQNSIVSDTIMPELVSFSFSPQHIDVMDVGEFFNASSRRVVFTLETGDVNGILLGSLPRIYLQDKRTDLIWKDATLQGSTATTAVYECVFEIPFGYGFGSDIWVSVYGIVDNQSNFNGYTMSQLASKGFNNKITTVPQLTNKLMISSPQEIKGSHSRITIFGRNFKLTNSLLIDYSNGTVATLNTCIFSTSNVIIFSTTPISASSIIVTVRDDTLHSNSLVVEISDPFVPIPDASSSSHSLSSSDSSSTSLSSSSSDDTPIPTNTPHSCVGNCGGPDQGTCTANGCVCKSPWVGLSCSSQVIIIDPVVNTTTPSTNITVPTNDKNTAIYYAIISVVALNELDRDGVIVNRHPFPQWLASNNTASKYSLYTNSSYFYTASINNTNVSVAIDYFNQATPTNITFAGQVLEMSPYSLKYSINLTEYAFQSSFNTLQLVLTASIESSDAGSPCAASEFGETVADGAEYVKMQVNDHSLYGRFVKRGIIDGRIKSVSNQLLDTDYNTVHADSKLQSFIAINIPFYKQSVQLDPDFSILLDNRPASDSSNAVCKQSKSSLTGAQIAGIVIGGVCFAAIVVIIITYAIYKTKKQRQFDKDMSIKLDNISK
ncbi:hypothetical protein CYY_007497 [Polysphondylium violaceum]|uniref:EGF-like domain-containing protein n=1 Tax=Polysphondylium violaceum TaxID=133409 RepID=A0A8J4PQW2_9MYCE|nr:hypothetical protein CYY_007497 [Polysphondylium violaceum]